MTSFLGSNGIIIIIGLLKLLNGTVFDSKNFSIYVLTCYQMTYSLFDLYVITTQICLIGVVTED